MAVKTGADNIKLFTIMKKSLSNLKKDVKKVLNPEAVKGGILSACHTETEALSNK